MKRMTRDHALNFFVYGAMLLLAASFVIGTRAYEGRERLVPIVIGVPTIVLLVIITVLEIRPLLKARGTDGGTQEQQARATSGSLVDAGSLKRVVTVYGWILGYFIATFIFGYYIATPIFLVVFFIKESLVPPLPAVGTTILVSIVLLLVFRLILAIPLWPGILPQIWPHYIGGGSIPPL